MRLNKTQNQVPVAVKGHSGPGRVAAQDVLDRAPCGLHLRVVQPVLLVHRRAARRHQPGVALAQRHRQLLTQPEHQLAARAGLASFHAAQVARGHIGIDRQVELTHPPQPAPGRRWSPTMARRGDSVVKSVRVVMARW